MSRTSHVPTKAAFSHAQSYNARLFSGIVPRAQSAGPALNPLAIIRDSQISGTFSDFSHNGKFVPCLKSNFAMISAKRMPGVTGRLKSRRRAFGSHLGGRTRSRFIPWWCSHSVSLYSRGSFLYKPLYEASISVEERQSRLGHLLSPRSMLRTDAQMVPHSIPVIRPSFNSSRLASQIRARAAGVKCEKYGSLMTGMFSWQVSMTCELLQLLKVVKRRRHHMIAAASSSGISKALARGAWVDPGARRRFFRFRGRRKSIARRIFQDL